MATSHGLNAYQLHCRLSFGFCPVCLSRGTGLHRLVDRVIVDPDDRSFKGSFLVCSGNGDHNHYYLSKGSATSGPRERKGAALPPAEKPAYEGTRIIRRKAA
jgi:hypothetical protein